MTATAMVDQVDLGDHVCWAHDEGTDGLDAAGRFVATGLRLGHKVIWFTDALSPSAARAHLEPTGAPVQAALANGQLRILPPSDRPPVLDLSQLSFADVRAARELVRADRAAPAGLRLVGTRPGLTRLLDLLGGDPPAGRPA